MLMAKIFFINLFNSNVIKFYKKNRKNNNNLILIKVNTKFYLNVAFSISNYFIQ